MGRLLQTSAPARAAELLVVFGVVAAVVLTGERLVGANPIARQAVVWCANVLMLLLIWLGLRLRGQGWDHFGLSLTPGSRRDLLRTSLQSVVVFVAALAAFALGAIVMANITGIPEGADMSGYDYLRGNLPLLLLALCAVYIVSSFGEEVVYRGFLITRVAEMGGGGRAAWRIAVGLGAVVFGLVHYDWGLIGIVETGFMGLALGISWLWLGRRLWPLVLAHAYMDTILMVQMYAGGG